MEMATPKKDPKDYLKRGRPTKYTNELAMEICDAISSSSLSLKELADSHNHWPDAANIWKWRNTNLEFRAMYANAKKSQVEVSIDFMQEMLNEPHKFIDPETGLSRIDVPMLRTKIDAIKWKASKLLPKDYGDLKQMETINSEVDEDSKKRFAEMDARNKKDC